ncbi:MAG: acyltransferase [Lachnospiraceae bacterium]|nr:acyltransferase [Lachnospiraceae bacterium]
MTKGMAILCMMVLHLFCRTGEDVLGTPLLWINETTPLVFWFGFFAEICVPIYSLCAGYAQQLLKEQGKLTWESNVRRIIKLLVNYWIVLALFCGLGFLLGIDPSIPGSLTDFIKSIVLVHSYNGAWWYLNTYILLLLIPHQIWMWPVKKIKYQYGLVFCLLFQVGWYFITRLNMIPSVPQEMPVAVFLEKEVVNLLGIMPYILAGAFLRKGRLMEKCNDWMQRHIPHKLHNTVLLLFGGVLFICTNLAHKAVFVGIVSVLSFLMFNLLKKSKPVKKVFLFLGKHSTNIWLTHMFFYAYLFKDLVTIVKYPLLMLAFMFLLCIMTSYVVMGIESVICKLCKWKECAL